MGMKNEILESIKEQGQKSKDIKNSCHPKQSEASIIQHVYW